MKPDFERVWNDLADDDDEIEIIEVVGLDEDSPAASPVLENPHAAGVAEEDPDEFVLDFGGDDDVTVYEDGLDQSAEADAASEILPAAPAGRKPGPAGNLSLEESQDRLVRLQADFENLVKRTEREGDEIRARANESLVSRILPIIDNFERAMQLDIEHKSDAFREGVVLIFRQLLDEMRKEGLDAIEAVGARFDPVIHEAVDTDRPGESAYRIAEEVQRGYRLKGRLLRPSLVKVVYDPTVETDE